MNKRKQLFLFLGLMFSCAVPAQEYTALDKTVTEAVQNNETVVEFFSFSCPACYAFSQGYGIDRAIRESLPPGKNWLSIMSVFRVGREKN